MSNSYVERLEKMYEDVNHRIDLNMEAQESIGKEMDRFIVENDGNQSSELDAKFQGLCDAMTVLLDERHEIARKINASS